MGGINLNKAFISVSAAAILLGAALLPAGGAQTTLVDLSLGFVFDETFDDNDGGWSASPVPEPVRPDPTATWEWGIPTSGPALAASGLNVWATHLGGNYVANECAALATPPIDLTAATSASVSFKEWHHFEQSTATGTGWDAGILMVTTDGGATFSVVTPDGGYTTNTLGTTVRACFDGGATTLRGLTGPFGTTPPLPVYNTLTTDLSAWAGQTIQFVIAFGSDGTGHRAGWYVDDVAITVDGVTTVEDFESSDGGFSFMGTKIPPAQPLGWEWGTPTVGPIGEDAMWATQVDRNHGTNECSWIESPAFVIGDYPPELAGPVRATLSWSQWFKSGSTSGAGVVQVGTADGSYVNLAPTTGYPANPTSTVLDACLDHRENGGAFAGFLSADASMTEYEADLTGFLGQEITIRFLFASTTSTVTYEGWFVDDVAVELSAYAQAPAVEDVIDGLGIPGLGSGSAPGWTQGGDASSWAYGVATDVGPAGETVYGTNLAGNYNYGECSWIESPAMPGALVAANPTVSFDQWYRIESVFSGSAWDGGIVLVSLDGGATWSYVQLDAYDKPAYTSLTGCLAAHGVAAASPVFSGVMTEWETVSFTLAGVGPESSVKVRFLFGSDSSVVYEGWYLKNVNVGGVKLL